MCLGLASSAADVCVFAGTRNSSRKSRPRCLRMSRARLSGLGVRMRWNSLAEHQRGGLSVLPPHTPPCGGLFCRRDGEGRADSAPMTPVYQCPSGAQHGAIAALFRGCISVRRRVIAMWWPGT